MNTLAQVEQTALACPVRSDWGQLLFRFGLVIAGGALIGGLASNDWKHGAMIGGGIGGGLGGLGSALSPVLSTGQRVVLGFLGLAGGASAGYLIYQRR